MNNIVDFGKKIKDFIHTDLGRDIYLSIIIVLTATASFGLGRLSKISHSGEGIVHTQWTSKDDLLRDGGVAKLTATVINSGAGSPEKQSGNQSGSESTKSGPIVASKNGAKYYLPLCGGIGRIKVENRIYFNTEDEAIAAGYQKSLTCK